MLYRSLCSTPAPHCPPQREIRIPLRDGRDLYFGDDILRGHILTLGGPRTGKTNFLLQLSRACRLAYPQALFVFLDVKGDFLPLYRPGDKLCTFYPVNGGNYAYFRHNLVRECLQSGQMEDEIREIAARLFKDQVEHSGGNRFFPRAAQQLFAAYFITVLRRCSDGVPCPTNRQILAHLHTMDAQRMRQRLMLDPDLQAALNSIASTGNGLSNQAAGVMAELTQFADTFFAGMLAGDGQDTVHDFLTGPGGRALFLEYDMRREESSNLLFRFLLSTMIQNRLSDARRPRQIFLVLDEFAALKGEYGLLNALHIGAAGGLRVIGGLQSKEQVYRICDSRTPEHTGNALLGGFSTLFAFHPNDEESLAFVQKRLGEGMVTYTDLGLSRYDPPQRITRREPLVESAAIQSLGLGEAYVKMREYKPQRVRFIRFTG